LGMEGCTALLNQGTRPGYQTRKKKKEKKSTRGHSQKKTTRKGGGAKVKTRNVWESRDDPAGDKKTLHTKTGLTPGRTRTASRRRPQTGEGPGNPKVKEKSKYWSKKKPQTRGTQSHEKTGPKEKNCVL